MSRYLFANLMRMLLGLLSIAVLVVVSLALPAAWPPPSLFIAAALFTAFVANFVVLLTKGEASLVHIVGIGGVWAYGPVPAGWIVAVGMMLGSLIRSVWRRSPAFRDLPPGERLGCAAMDVAQQVFSVLAGGLAYAALGGSSPLAGFGLAAALPTFGLLLGFAGVYNLALIWRVIWEGDDWRSYFRGNWQVLLILELLPVPFAALAAISLHTLGREAFALFAALLATVSVVLHRLGSTRVDLEKRLRELSSLGKVSRALRTSLDLPALLDTIYLQVAHLLDVSSFYVALFDFETDTVSFPISIKNGARQQWPSRRSAPRLTDWVIRSRAPLLVPYDLPATLHRLGLEPGDEYPQAWMGVPLVASDRTIGCLAVMSFIPGRTFTQDNLNILTTLAAQASVAIENAQLYGQTQRRATELATLTRISALMSATLDPERVLELVCASILDVMRCQKSAIFLLAEDRRELYLARAEGMSEAFLQASLTLSLDDAPRVRAVATGQPVVVGDVRAAGVAEEIGALAAAEGYRAYADMPLQAQGETIGLLSVFFSEPHHFRQAEVEVLKTFGNQAALAVTNARLYARTDQALARRVEQIAALEAIGRELTATLDLERLFDVVLNRAMEATRASVGSLVIYDAAKGGLLLVASRGYPPEIAEKYRREPWPLDKGITGRVQQTGVIALVPDVSQDPDFADLAEGIRSQLSVPVVRENRVMGVITVESTQPAAFTQEDANFVAQIAVQAAIALENARLFQRVAEGRDRLAAVLDSTREAVLMIDAHGRIALANPRVEEYWGLQRSDLVGQGLDRLLGDPALGLAEKLGYLKEELDYLLAALRRGEAPVTSKASYRVSGPKPRYFERSGAPVHDDAGRVIGWVMVLRDITEAKELEEVREDLTNMIIHDLRAPLTAVLGGLNLIETVLPEDDRDEILRQALEVSLRSSKRILSLVDALLDISRLESGEVQLARTPVRLGALVEEVLADLMPMANEQGVILINQTSPDVPPVAVDEDKVERVFINLIDNALKFTPPGGQVSVQTLVGGQPEAGNGMVVCRVLDTGPGIPEAYREKIFDRFAQIPGRQGRRRGTGLGLAFCKLAVEAHGGRIWVENRPQGGSIFAFTLPMGSVDA